MNRLSPTFALLASLALLGVSTPVLAEQLNLTATLTGTDEVPANDSTATGMLEGTFDTDTNILTYSVTYSGLSGDATAAHFHGPAAPGEKAPPSLPVDGALNSPISGTATLSDGQETDLLAGHWYFNVHTAKFPDGEIRGQVMQGVSTDTSTDSSMSSMSDMSSSEMMSSSSEPATSSLSSSLSSVASSALSEASSAVSDVSTPDVSVSASVSVDVSASVSVSAP
ncbi:MAG: CHRD domain-containing protein [Devosia sp.]